MGKSKVVFGNTVVMDISDSTVDESHLLSGVTAYDHNGDKITGTCDFDADTKDATALVGEILLNKTAYVNGNKLTGSMPNRGSVSGTISTKAGAYSIQNGYHDGSGTVEIDSVEQAKIIGSNIKQGVQILGVTGTYGGEETPTQTKSATPYTTSQVVLPDAGYALSQVNIAAISYSEAPNPAGGITVTIGDVAPS